MPETLEKQVKLQTGLETLMRAWIPEVQPKAVVVGIHGFAEHSGRYSHVGSFLAEHGFSLYMYDLRGHGLSKGVRGYLDSFNQFVEDTIAFFELVFKEVNGVKLFLLGHSMGGLIAVHVAAKLNDEISGLITSGAALELKVKMATSLLLKLLSILKPTGRTRLPVAVDCLSKDKEVIDKYMVDPLVFKDPTYRLLAEFGKGVSEVWNLVGRISVPALIMHGEDDCLVPPTASQKLYDRLPSSKKMLKMYKGLKHEIFNETEKEIVFKDLAEWLNKHTVNI
ncbi:MAG: alpha/beta hydrolase [Thermofilaceae archaeon]